MEESQARPRWQFSVRALLLTTAVAAVALTIAIRLASFLGLTLSDELLIGLVAASLATWIALARRMRHGPILRFERRRPVPWSGAATLLAIGFVTIVFVEILVGGDHSARDADMSSVTILERMGESQVIEVFLVGAVMAAIVVLSGATQLDLGLPEFADEFLRDVKIGVVAWLAALVPVYGTQVLLVLTFGEPSQHPLIQMVSKDPNGLILVGAFIAAVVVAPVCEEIMFRLLLQGWLEKWEDARLGWRAVSAAASTEIATDIVLEELPRPANDLAAVDPAEASPSDGVAEVAAAVPIPTEPPRRGLFGLPHGWLPILVSSLLFALAHYGNGPDPIPLFLLALALGYVYQRTHRIVPCMVTHALFNALTLVALWRALSTGEPIPP